MSPGPDFTALLTDWRHQLHAKPELSRNERHTAAFICEKLAAWGIEFTAGIGGHGVVATLSRGASNRSVGLRGDMDALPIEETTGLAYASTASGVMHACGHDGHTTSLLGAAWLLQQDPGWTGTVHLIFQPAEEGAGGAQAMLDDGLLQRFPIERIFAYHNWPGLGAGQIAVLDGAVMASASRLDITIEGVAGHAGTPHLARDPLLAACHCVSALQSVVARSIDPLDSGVVSICVLESGRAANQIAQRAVLRGTFRAHRPAVRDAMQAAIERVATGSAAAFGTSALVEIRHGTPPLVNPHEEAEFARQTLSRLGLETKQNLAPSMVSEDFGAYLQHVPGAFLWIGNGDSAGLHSPDYDFNDAILPIAARGLASLARAALD
ncbi:MAG: amidohydrolase [Acidocella sp.]|nr:amidohydrolase [Acidocella sp.]